MRKLNTASGVLRNAVRINFFRRKLNTASGGLRRRLGE
jgi:hypothetical protein